MPNWRTIRPPLLRVLAVLFAIATISYSCLWMYHVRYSSQQVELGFDNSYSVAGHFMLVKSVVPASPAEQAGMRANDRIVAVNGQRLNTREPFDTTWLSAHPGDSVHLTVDRSGEPAPLVLHGVFRPRAQQGSKLSKESLARTSALEIVGSFPVPFLIVGLAVLFLRVDSLYAWLAALLFGGFVAAPAFPDGYFGLSPAVQAFAMSYRAVFCSLVGPMFYFFFAVFPARSPLDRRVPWLKWAGLVTAAWLALAGLKTGEPGSPAILIRLFGAHAANISRLSLLYGFVALGLISLLWNALSPYTAEAGRKTRLILWGTVIGVTPVVTQEIARDFWGVQVPFWVDIGSVILLFLFPLSFAYAVVKHRVLEIPILLRRSARYVLVRRGFAVLIVLFAASVNALFTVSFSRFFAVNARLAMSLGVGFGIFLAIVASPLLKRSTDRIDRAFFRGAYDARMILQDLAEKARTVTSRHELAALLEHHLNQALHPSWLAAYLETTNTHLVAECGRVPAGLESLSMNLPILSEVAQRAEPWEAPHSDGEAVTEWQALSPLEPECLVPLLGRDSRLVGLLILGPRLSEEPYSGEDKQLLASVASQAGIAVESIHLAEQMAERIEAERRTAYEMEIARQVQARLFPQMLPPLRTLDYAGGCIQARKVGGDYYDFLDLGPGRLGLVLADISGKGMSGALLMANLQANLRSQYAVALDDMPRLLQSVNRLFYENTPDDCYATLFFGCYDDANRALRYVNCGHNAALLLRADGTLERLASTSTVLGLFENWECIVANTSLSPGNLLTIYTDGITEARNEHNEEFGEPRLVELLRKNRDLPVRTILHAINAGVEQFSDGAQADDLTLVLARCRLPA